MEDFLDTRALQFHLALRRRIIDALVDQFLIISQNELQNPPPRSFFPTRQFFLADLVQRIDGAAGLLETLLGLIGTEFFPIAGRSNESIADERHDCYDQ